MAALYPCPNLFTWAVLSYMACRAGSDFWINGFESGNCLTKSVFLQREKNFLITAGGYRLHRLAFYRKVMVDFFKAEIV